jgi:hypothetical protein
MVVARLLVVVVAPLLVAVPAYAQRETEGQKHALAQFSDELATCYAYCQVISRCFGGSKSAHNPENIAVSQQYAVRAKLSVDLLSCSPKARAGPMTQHPPSSTESCIMSCCEFGGTVPMSSAL